MEEILPILATVSAIGVLIGVAILIGLAYGYILSDYIDPTDFNDNGTDKIKESK